MTNLAIRSWNNTPISRRTTDGYVNATAMCKANEKRWYDYRESERCQAYLDALAQTTEIPVFELAQPVALNDIGQRVCFDQLPVDVQALVIRDLSQ